MLLQLMTVKNLKINDMRHIGFKKTIYLYLNIR